MHFLFQKCLKIGKSIRTSFPQVVNQVHLEGILFQVCQSLFPQIQGSSVLFIGNSEINRKILSFFKAKGMDKITLCTRAKHTVEEEYKKEGVEVVDWAHLPKWHEHEIVISGTNTSHYLIDPLQVKDGDVFPCRLLFDLSIPRTIDPALSRHPQLSLLNVEEVGNLVQKRQNRRRLELFKMDEYIRAAAEQQVGLFQRKQVVTCV
jgi:glutamyl-tRNA reductase